MGLVINPVGYRIGYSQYWVDAWYLHRMYYPVFVHKSLEMKLLLEYCLRRRSWRKSFWVYSHFTFFYFNDKFNISVFFYDGVPENLFSEDAGKFKFRAWTNLRLKSVFRKRQVLHNNFFATRLWLFSYLLNFKIEKFNYEELTWGNSRKTLKKIRSLKRKYGKGWIAKEELVAQQFLSANHFFSHYNKMGMIYFNRVYKLYINNLLKEAFRKEFKNSNSYYFRKNFIRLRKIARSYKSMFFFFSFVDKLFKHMPMYPLKFFNRKSMKHQIKTYRLYFVFRPYWIQMSKFYELLFVYINIPSKISVYYLSNPHLSAQYISRYIMTTLKYKFDYKDTLTPIKKTLNRILFVKNWDNTNRIKLNIWNRYIDTFDRYVNNRRDFYRSLFVYNLKIFNKFKMIEYLKKIKSLKKYKLKYIHHKKSKFRRFNVAKFIKNLRYIKNNIVLINRKQFLKNNSIYNLIKKKSYLVNKHKLENNKFFLMKKNKFKIRKNKKTVFLNKLLFFYRRRLLWLFKNKIIKRLKKYYNKPIYLRKRKYIFLRLRYLIRKNRSNYKLTKAVNLFYNFKSKYNPLRRKIYKIIKLYNKIWYLKLRKLNLVKISLVNIFFMLKKINFLYKISNGFFYNYMNSFNKSIAFISLKKIQTFWLKRKLRKDSTEFYRVNWKKNIKFIFFNRRYRLRRPRTFRLLLNKFSLANYFPIKKKSKYKIKLRNIKFNIRNNKYNIYINKIFKVKNLKFKIYNLVINKFIYFLLNYKKRYLINMKKNMKKNIKKNIKNSMLNVLRVLFRVPSIIHFYKKKYIYFFKEVSNFFLFKYYIFNKLFNSIKYFHIKNNFLTLNNFNDKFIFFSLVEAEERVFNRYYNNNIIEFKDNDDVRLNYLENKRKWLKGIIKKISKGRLKRKKGKILNNLDNIFITKSERREKFAIEQKVKKYYNRFFKYNFKKYYLKKKIIKIKKFYNKLIKKIKLITKKIKKSKIWIKRNKLKIKTLKKKKWYRSMYKMKRKFKNLRKQIKYLILRKIKLILKLRKLKLKKLKLKKLLKIFLRKQLKLFKFLLSLNKHYPKGDFLFSYFKKFKKFRSKIRKKKNKFQRKLYYYQKFELFRDFRNRKIESIRKFKRGYFVIFIRSFIDNYSKNYLPFVFNLDLYGNYLQRLFNLPFIKYQIMPKKVKKNNLEVTPLINKFRKLRYLEANKTNVLYGYKFHFSGRFTRKQKAASWWYIKGSIPASSMSYNVDYGYFTITLRYSACTLKVWLYKNKRISPKYGIKMV